MPARISSACSSGASQAGPRVATTLVLRMRSRATTGSSEAHAAGLVEVLRLDLDRAVADLEAVVQEVADLLQELARVAVVARDDVAGEGDHAARDGPDVQVVHGGDPGEVADRALDLAHVEVRGSPFHQHADRLAQQGEGRPEDEARDEQRRDRIGPGPAEGEHERSGGDRADAPERVARDVEPGAAYAEVVLAARPEERQRGEVHGEAERGDREHRSGEDRGRPPEATERLDPDRDRDGDEEHAVRERGQDLGAVEAVGLLRSPRSLREGEREQGERERRDVGEHVPGVGQQRQRPGPEPADRLRQHRRRGEAEREPEAAAALRLPRPPIVGVHRRKNEWNQELAQAAGRAASARLHGEGPALVEGDVRALETQLVGVYAGLGVRGELDEGVEHPAPGPDLEALARLAVHEAAAEADALHQAPDLHLGRVGRAEHGDEAVVELAARRNARRDDLAVLDREEGEGAPGAAVLLRHLLREVREVGSLLARRLLDAPAQRRAAGGQRGEERAEGGDYLRVTHPRSPPRCPRARVARGAGTARAARFGSGSGSTRAGAEPPTKAPKGSSSGADAAPRAGSSASGGAGQSSPAAST